MGKVWECHRLTFNALVEWLSRLLWNPREICHGLSPTTATIYECDKHMQTGKGQDSLTGLFPFAE